jgi:RNA recognition motif-containing protein
MFPSWLDYQDLKRAFSNISPVTNLFVFRKKTKRGRQFGFVSFFSHLEDADLCDRLNLIWFDSFKIRANLARFQTPTDSREKTALTTKPETKISPKLALRDNKTFVEALLVQQPSKKTVVSLHRMTRNGY